MNSQLVLWTVGTLTQNEMIFKRLHLGTVSYGTDTMDEIQNHIVQSYAQVSHLPVSSSMWVSKLLTWSHQLPIYQSPLVSLTKTLNLYQSFPAPLPVFFLYMQNRYRYNICDWNRKGSTGLRISTSLFFPCLFPPLPVRLFNLFLYLAKDKVSGKGAHIVHSSCEVPKLLTVL